MCGRRGFSSRQGPGSEMFTVPVPASTAIHDAAESALLPILPNLIGHRRDRRPRDHDDLKAAIDLPSAEPARVHGPCRRLAGPAAGSACVLKIFAAGGLRERSWRWERPSRLFPEPDSGARVSALPLIALIVPMLLAMADESVAWAEAPVATPTVPADDRAETEQHAQ